MKIIIPFNSIEEARYTAIKVAHAGLDFRINQVVRNDDGVEVAFIIPDGMFITVCMLGFYNREAHYLTTQDHDFKRFSIGGVELEDFIDSSANSTRDYTAYDYTNMEAYINFEDEDFVNPVISTYNLSTPFKAEVLSQEDVPSGHIAHVRINSGNPVAMLLLGQVFADQYEKTS